jgi:hypothetical protein
MYSIRALDSGSMSVDEFKKVLESAGIPITKELSLLLMRHQASGNASFHQFTRVIDPMLGPHEPAPVLAYDCNGSGRRGSESNVDMIGNVALASGLGRPHKAHVS